MNCREFENRIDVLAAGRASPEQADAAYLHAAECSRCRRLLDTARGEIKQLSRAQEDRLTSAILSRTSGRACMGAQDRLCDWVDGFCDAVDQEILAQHVDHCPPCAQLSALLIELGDILPQMAEVDPGTDFTAAVLQATAYAPAVIHAGAPVGAWGSWWSRLIRRPRFVWEAAYMGAMLMMLLLGNPSIRAKAIAWPQVVAEDGDRILAEAGTAITDGSQAAQISLSSFREKSVDAFASLAGLPGQTAKSFRDKAASIMEQWQLELQQPTPRDRR